MMLGLGLVEGSYPYDNEKIFSTAENLLKNDAKYNFCKDGYIVDRTMLPSYEKQVYVELLIKCRESMGSVNPK